MANGLVFNFTNITNRIKKSIKFINDDIRNIIILNGDSFYKFNLKKLINSKLQKKFFINLICTKLRLDYGFVIRKNNKISFNYKNQQFNYRLQIGLLGSWKKFTAKIYT